LCTRKSKLGMVQRRWCRGDAQRLILLAPPDACVFHACWAGVPDPLMCKRARSVRRYIGRFVTRPSCAVVRAQERKQNREGKDEDKRVGLLEGGGKTW